MVVPRYEQSYSFSLVGFTNAPYTAARRIESVLAKLGYEHEEDKDGHIRNSPDSFKRELVHDGQGVRVDVKGSGLCVWPKFGTRISDKHINDIIEQFRQERLTIR